MKRSWRNNSNHSSPGFVYYNVNNSYQSSPADTSDYLSFGESPTYSSPKPKKFSPTNYSSPQKYQGTPRNFNKRNNFRYSGGHNNHSFNSSNNSFNSSYNNSRRRESGPHNRKNFNSTFNKSFNNGGRDGDKKDMSMFYDPTCLEDPWAELEADLKRKQEAKTKEMESIDAPVLNDDDSSSDSENSEEEQESESDSKTSTSGADEETT